MKVVFYESYSSIEQPSLKVVDSSGYITPMWFFLCARSEHKPCTIHGAPCGQNVSIRINFVRLDAAQFDFFNNRQSSTVVFRF